MSGTPPVQPSACTVPRRATVLAAVLDPRRLPTPPAVALQVVSAASRPNCDPAEIVALLSQDPALCAKLLKAVNSCLYGLSKPVASLERAIAVLGLGPVRSLALGLSLPAIKTGPTDPNTRDYQITSVAGAIIARDLSARTPRSAPADDMVAGLLRELGAVLLQQTYPDAWRDMTARWGDLLVTDSCAAEEETFGVSHAEVSAELLTVWNMPPELVEPIRYHHAPEKLADAAPAVSRRAELLCFADWLARINVVVRYPAVLTNVLDIARTQFGFTRPELVKFLSGILPKVSEFGELLNRDVRDCPNFAEALAAGGQELVNLAVENNRNRMSGGMSHSATPRPGAPALDSEVTVDLWGSSSRDTHYGSDDTASAAVGDRADLPAFHPRFINDFPVTGCRLGDYELHELLARGAMGVVFKGYEPSLERFVAIKVLASEALADPTARARFAREARAGAAIRHENVVAIYAVREFKGLAYLAMEYVAGTPLDQYVQETAPVPVPVIARLGRQIALGTAAAHKKGIVHRDIKPSNILVERETGTAKVADFGLARSGADASLSQAGLLVGTPSFMAPEQINGNPASVASDLFSLGGVLYAMCAGEPPFPGTSLGAVLFAVCSRPPRPLREHRRDIPNWLEAVIMRLLEKNPENRFGSASEVAEALNRE
ncbi:MAG: protein kinase domain-containing protein [Gemmata sp.]